MKAKCKRASVVHNIIKHAYYTRHKSGAAGSKGAAGSDVVVGVTIHLINNGGGALALLTQVQSERALVATTDDGEVPSSFTIPATA